MSTLQSFWTNFLTADTPIHSALPFRNHVEVTTEWATLFSRLFCLMWKSYDSRCSPLRFICYCLVDTATILPHIIHEYWNGLKSCLSFISVMICLIVHDRYRVQRAHLIACVFDIDTEFSSSALIMTGSFPLLELSAFSSRLNSNQVQYAFQR